MVKFFVKLLISQATFKRAVWCKFKWLCICDEIAIPLSEKTGKISKNLSSATHDI